MVSFFLLMIVNDFVLQISIHGPPFSFKNISFAWQYAFYDYTFFIRHKLPFSMSIWHRKLIWKWVKWKYATNMLDHSKSTIRNLHAWLHIALWWIVMLHLLEVEEPKFLLSSLLYLIMIGVLFRVARISHQSSWNFQMFLQWRALLLLFHIKSSLNTTTFFSQILSNITSQLSIF